MNEPHKAPAGELASPPPARPGGPRTLRQAVGYEKPAARIYAAAFTAAYAEGANYTDAVHIARSAVRDFAVLLDETV